MPKKSYTQRDTTPDRTLKTRYLVEDDSVELLVSTFQDGNMDRRFSSDALQNYEKFLERHGFSPSETFSPAIGSNFKIISINETNEEKYAGRFIKNGTSQNEYHCDAVIVCGLSIPVAFRFGDCPPIVIVGQSPDEKKIVALVHAGRAELLAEVPKITVSRMVSDFKMHLRSSTAYVFPHICKHCYALGHVDQDTKEKARDFLEFSDDHFHLDLMGWLKKQLEEAGIQRFSTAFFRCTAGISPVCTSRLLHDKNIFKGLFSHYRSFHRKDLEDPEGRFVVAVRIVDRDHEEDLFQEN